MLLKRGILLNLLKISPTLYLSSVNPAQDLDF